MLERRTRKITVSISLWLMPQFPSVYIESIATRENYPIITTAVTVYLFKVSFSFCLSKNYFSHEWKRSSCSGRCWTTRGWLYKILRRPLFHPWYRTEPLFQNKGFLFAPARWRLMSPSWLFKFHTKGLFCKTGWSRKRRIKTVTAACFCSNSVVAIESSKGCRKSGTEENY